MTPIVDLWLAILLAAVLVFMASSVLHMVLPVHKSDCKKLSNEEALLGAMREQGLEPGEYVFPFADSLKEMGTPEMIARQNLGPVGFVTILPNGPVAIGKSLAQWFVYSLVLGVFVAYIVGMNLGPGASYSRVFHWTAPVAILAYAMGCVPNSIWKGQSWGVTLKFIFDGIIYGLVTAGVFGWLWPGAVG